MDGGGAQRPVSGGYELKKTGARSARARTRGHNPLVLENRPFGSVAKKTQQHFSIKLYFRI
jgi:hypothetical protein